MKRELERQYKIYVYMNRAIYLCESGNMATLTSLNLSYKVMNSATIEPGTLCLRIR